MMARRTDLRKSPAPSASGCSLIAGEHRGGNAARNTALAAARGEWLQFLDADDFLEPPKLAQQFTESHDGAESDVIYSPVWIDEAGARIRSTLDPAHDLFAQWIAWELPQTGGALWRREALERIGGWKEGLPCCQEHELYARALMAGLRFAFAPTPHAVYRVWSESTVCRRDPRQLVRVKTQLIDECARWLKAERTLDGRTSPAGRARVLRDGADARRNTTLPWRPLPITANARRAASSMPPGPRRTLPYRLVYHTLGFACAEKLSAAVTPLIPMRIHGICLVKNEGDIIRHFLTRSVAAGAIAFICMTMAAPTATWEIAQEMAKTMPQIILYRSEDKPFDDALRAECLRALSRRRRARRLVVPPRCRRTLHRRSARLPRQRRARAPRRVDRAPPILLHHRRSRPLHRGR